MIEPVYRAAAIDRTAAITKPVLILRRRVEAPDPTRAGTGVTRGFATPATTVTPGTDLEAGR